MKRTALFSLLLLLSAVCAQAQYVSPGTGEKVQFTTLAATHPQTVRSSRPGHYEVLQNITVSAGDTLLTEAGIRQIALGDTVCLRIQGTWHHTGDTLQVQPLEGDSGNGYEIRFESATASRLSGIRFAEGNSILLDHSDIRFDSCSFTGFAAPAVRMLSCNPQFRHCLFRDNRQSALNSAANLTASPAILHCTFHNNVRDNINQPQINLGPGGTDSILIVGNQIEGVGSDLSGGISVADLYAKGSTRVAIRQNSILHNRYGINLQGYRIQALVEDNIIKDNNLETNPMNGGSGISIYGGDSSCSVKLRRNLISGNLWGITAIYHHCIDMGTAGDYGCNRFYDNGNNGTLYALYNNAYDDINAIGNYWGGSEEAFADSVVFDHADNAGLGTVRYKPFLTADPAAAAIRSATPMPEMPRLGPNPADVYVKITADEIIICLELYDMAGRRIVQSAPHATACTLPVQDLPAGCYQMVILTAQGRYTKTLTVRH